MSRLHLVYLALRSLWRHSPTDKTPLEKYFLNPTCSQGHKPVKARAPAVYREMETKKM